MAFAFAVADWETSAASSLRALVAVAAVAAVAVVVVVVVHSFAVDCRSSDADSDATDSSCMDCAYFLA